MSTKNKKKNSNKIKPVNKSSSSNSNPVNPVNDKVDKDQTATSTSLVVKEQPQLISDDEFRTPKIFNQKPALMDWDEFSDASVLDKKETVKPVEKPQTNIIFEKVDEKNQQPKTNISLNKNPEPVQKPVNQSNQSIPIQESVKKDIPSEPIQKREQQPKKEWSIFSNVKERHKNRIRITRNKDLHDEIKSTLVKAQIDEPKQITENTPNATTLTKATLLGIRIEFNHSWFHEMLSKKPDALFVFYQQALRIFEKHQFYLTADWQNEVIYGYFAYNEDNDINQLFEIGSIINSYIKVWSDVIKELNLAFPVYKIVIDIFSNVYLSRLQKNFFNINPLNCNEFILLYNNTRLNDELKILEYSQNAFYISKVLSSKLKAPYQKLLISFNHEFDITTATTVLNDEFKW